MRKERGFVGHSPTSTRCYSDLVNFVTFEDRFNYLKITGVVGEMTAGYARYINQEFYRSKEWRSIRNKIIIRDDGCDLGIPGLELHRYDCIIHHLNPITISMIRQWHPFVWSEEYLICTSKNTHNAIHYGANQNPSELVRSRILIERKPNDTVPWK